MRQTKKIISLIFYILLIFAVAYGLWYNERWNKEEIRYEEGLKSLTIITLDTSMINPANEGSLVVVSGILEPDDIIKDPIVSFQTTPFQLRKIVEVYQWSKKKQRKEKNSTSEKAVYKYRKGWEDELIKSSDFDGEHQNPDSFPTLDPFDTYLKSSKLRMGDFSIPSLEADSSIFFSQRKEKINLVEIKQQLTYGEFTGQIYQWSTGKNHILFGKKLGLPKIGEVQIYYEGINPDVYTLLAQQKQGKLIPYEFDGINIFKIEKGKLSKADMLRAVTHGAKGMRLTLRALGILVLGMFLFSIIRISRNREEFINDGGLVDEDFDGDDSD